MVWLQTFSFIFNSPFTSQTYFSPLLILCGTNLSKPHIFVIIICPIHFVMQCAIKIIFCRIQWFFCYPLICDFLNVYFYNINIIDLPFCNNIFLQYTIFVSLSLLFSNFKSCAHISHNATCLVVSVLNQ